MKDFGSDPELQPENQGCVRVVSGNCQGSFRDLSGRSSFCHTIVIKKKKEKKKEVSLKGKKEKPATMPCF